MTAYGDTNLFCTCAPVEDEDSDITGIEDLAVQLAAGRTTVAR